MPIEVEADTERMRPAASEVERLWACTDKAERVLGWKPEYAGRDGLQRGVRNTAEWLAARGCAKPDRYEI